jgi:hypothetical protein
MGYTTGLELLGIYGDTRAALRAGLRAAVRAGPRAALRAGPRAAIRAWLRAALRAGPRANLSATAPLDLRASGPTAQIHINGHRGPAPLELAAGVVSRCCWDRIRVCRLESKHRWTGQPGPRYPPASAWTRSHRLGTRPAQEE